MSFVVFMIRDNSSDGEGLRFWIRRYTTCSPKMLLVEKKRDFFVAAYLKYFLNLNGYEIEFVDEFHVNFHSEDIKNLSPVNTRALIAVKPNNESCLFELQFQK